MTQAEEGQHANTAKPVEPQPRPIAKPREVPIIKMNVEEDVPTAEDEDDDAREYSDSDIEPDLVYNNKGKKVEPIKLVKTTLAKPYNEGDLILRIPE